MSIGGKEEALIMREQITAPWATLQHGTVGRQKGPAGSSWWDQEAKENLSVTLVPLRVEEEEPMVGRETPTSFLRAVSAAGWRCLCRHVWAQPQLRVLTRAGNHLASAITPSLASKPCAQEEGEREEEKAARKAGRAEEEEKGTAELRQESQKSSLQAVTKDN